METDASLPRKRARATFSCRECKRKKMKCDRGQPCAQCSRLARGLDCSYEDGDISMTTSLSINQPEQNIPQQDLDDLRRRVTDIERRLQTHNGTSMPSVISPAAGDNKFRNHLRRKGNTTRFHSHLSWKSCGSEFPDVREFLESLGASKFHSLKEGTYRLQSSSQKIEDFATCSRSTTEAKMLLCLSSQKDCSFWTQRYTATFENVFPILNEQELKRQIELFWQDNHRFLQSDDSVLPKLFALTSLGSTFDSITINSGGNVSMHTRTAERAALLKHWLSFKQGKKRLCLEVVQLEVLLALMSSTLLDRADESWLQKGALLQLAMAVGLHRDPSEFGGFTDIETEQRRALWFTIIELCLQDSMKCSMPLLTPKFSCHPPEDGTILAHTLTLRCDVWNILIEAEAVLDKAALLTRLKPLLDLMSQRSLSTDEDSSPSTIFVRHVHTGILNRVITYCYRQIGFGADNDPMAINKTEQLNTLCLNLLLMQDLWDPQTSALNQDETLRYWDIHYNFFREDVIRSIMYLCLYTRSQKLWPLKLGRAGQSAEISNISRAVDNAIDALVRRLQSGDINKEIKTVIYLSIIHACARSTVEKGKFAVAEQALERALSKCHVRLNELADAQLRTMLILSTTTTRTNSTMETPVSTSDYFGITSQESDPNLYPIELDSTMYNFQLGPDEWLFEL